MGTTMGDMEYPDRKIDVTKQRIAQTDQSFLEVFGEFAQQGKKEGALSTKSKGLCKNNFPF